MRAGWAGQKVDLLTYLASSLSKAPLLSLSLPFLPLFPQTPIAEDVATAALSSVLFDEVQICLLKLHSLTSPPALIVGRRASLHPISLQPRPLQPSPPVRRCSVSAEPLSLFISPLWNTYISNRALTLSFKFGRLSLSEIQRVSPPPDQIVKSPAKKWEAIVKNAQACLSSGRMYCYIDPKQTTGVVFNILGDVLGLCWV